MTATAEHAVPTPIIATIDLTIGGMTCASCVARVEKRIGRLPGATAVVNLATETAHVELTGPVDPQALVGAVESAGYTATVTGVAVPGTDDDTQVGSEADLVADLRRRLMVAAILTVPVVTLTMIPALQFPGWQWVVAVLALPVVTWAAMPFHRAAARAARHGASTMDTLVSLGVVAATGWSLWALLLGGAGQIGMQMQPTLIPRAPTPGMDVPELYFEVAAVVTTFLLAGRNAEHRSRRRTGDALRTLLSLGATDVTLLVGDSGARNERSVPVGSLQVGDSGARSERRVPVGSLQVGDVFAVRPGEKVATDGMVVDGTSAVDTSLLTGEPVPVDVGPGSHVTGATINTFGYLVVRAERVGEQTMLAQIGRLVTQAQTGKAPVQRLADRVSAVFVPVVIVIAVATLAAWLATGAQARTALTAAVAVLIISCPCALGLATPTALLVGTGRGAQLGILIRGPEILESTRRVDTVVLDKTGTITEGRMRVADVIPAVGTSPRDVLRYAAAVESRSEHPVASAIAEAGLERGPGKAAEAAIESGTMAGTEPGTMAGTEPGAPAADEPGAAPGAPRPATAADEVTEFVNHPGRGVVGVVRAPDASLDHARRVLVGKPSWLRDQGMDTTALDTAVTSAQTDGATVVMVAWDGTARGVIVLRDPVKATSFAAIDELRTLGLRPVLLTGDNADAARAVAAPLGIARVHAEVLPADKVGVVRALQQEGRVVAMVGDGVNDAAALAQADLGLAMGTGTDAAMQAADITLVRGDLRSVGQAIRLSRQTLRIIKQNLAWAFAYNVAAIPLAAFGLLNPMIAGAAMAFSSVLVVTNALRLRRAG